MTLLFLALWLQMSAPHWSDGPIRDNSGWTTADESWIVPKGECGQHEDGSFTDCCGALMKFSLIQELNQAAQRAADETDGKPPKYQEPVDINQAMCADSNTLPYPCNQPPAEPMDVPAVQVPIQSNCMFLTSKAEWICSDHGTPDFPKGAFSDAMPGKGGYIETCADKSRILLTSEDGKKHCIEF